MQYATLDEAYNVSSFKKPKKNKKIYDKPLTTDVKPFDLYDNYETNLEKSDFEKTKTTKNHCESIQAPPYRFPVEEKAKIQFDKALKDMNKIDSKIESNIGDELDSYLDDVEYEDFNTEEPVQKPVNKKITKKNPVSKPKEKEVINELKNDRLYELILLILLAVLIIILCEIIVRIAIR